MPGQARLGGRNHRTPTPYSAQRWGLNFLFARRIYVATGWPPLKMSASALESGHRPQHLCFALATWVPSTTLKPDHSEESQVTCLPQQAERPSAKAQPTVTRITPSVTGFGHTSLSSSAQLPHAFASAETMLTVRAKDTRDMQPQRAYEALRNTQRFRIGPAS